ncbi:uncharacterized protein BYT42DRAFT_618445 [Radiomyces spectabilis]|uniref:uncharacterized protein n=1 Tax=Radiomyces spectabilis TaxID=64574 RepID=UPI00221ED02E|nr:uncharacterized protein BYT42DRAFT_618445 [Radiomyces spectabilis]KAI8366001.1 hypothetical protein BYT42DRAFT_618445 [Radiomyces spectabilis]
MTPSHPINDDDAAYFTLSQFDFELQQQAQAVLQQGIWQDFDRYLPMDDAPLYAPPPPSSHLSSTHNSLLFGQPMTHPSQPPPSAPTTAGVMFTQLDNNPLMGNLTKESMPSSIPSTTMPTPIVPSQRTEDEKLHINTVMTSVPAAQDTLYTPSIDPHPAVSPPSTVVSSNAGLDKSLETDFSSHYPVSSTTYLSPPEAPATQQSSPLSAPSSQMPWNMESSPENLNKDKIAIERLKPATTAANGGTMSSNGNRDGTTPGPGRAQKKTAHNAIERRYRNNINDRIAELKNAVPALLHAKVKDARTGKRSYRDDDDDDAEDGEEYLDGVAVATKLNKATILRKATEYILHLKKVGDDMGRENAILQHLLSQLPGGQDVLARYQMHRMQREQEIHRQRILERQLQKHQQQQRKAAGRKRSRYQAEPHGEEYESSSSSGSVGPVTPPAMANRVFMALFMCLTFFSSSPLTSGSNSTEQFQNHQHTSRTSSSTTDPITSASATRHTADANPSILGFLFPFEDKWATLHTAVFMVCLLQLFFPYVKSWFGVSSSSSSLKMKRVPRVKKVTQNRRRPVTGKTGAAASFLSSNHAITPGDQKYMQLYDILINSLARDNDAPNPHTSGTVWPLCKETARMISRHVFGYDILYEDNVANTTQEEWGRVCKWIKLSEIQCLGGNADLPRWTLLYTCIRAVNLAESLDEEEHQHSGQARARAYANAAMHMAAFFPLQSLATKLARYFWRLTVWEADLDEDDTNEESAAWMQSLLWYPMEEEDQLHDDPVDNILDSAAWKEMIGVVRLKTDRPLLRERAGGATLSYTSPVMVPLALLSSLHLFESLHDRYIGLIDWMVNTSSADVLDVSDSMFDPVLDVSVHVKDLHLVRWFAMVGATVQALWRHDTPTAETCLTSLAERIPAAVFSTHEEVTDNAMYQSRLNQQDDMMKRSMVHMLKGAILLLKEDLSKDQRHQGIRELEKAEELRNQAKRFMTRGKETGVARTRNKSRKVFAGASSQKSSADASVEELGSLSNHHLEHAVMAFAEFAVAMIGLEAWILALQFRDAEESQSEAREKVCSATLNLRRMIRRRSLDGLRTKQMMIDRLSRLGRFVAQQPDEVDSACECIDSDMDDASVWEQHDEDDHTVDDEHDEAEILTRRSAKARDILRGLA